MKVLIAHPKKYIVVTNKSLQVDQYLKRRVVKALARERFPIVMKMSSFAFVKQLHFYKLTILFIFNPFPNKKSSYDFLGT